MKERANKFKSITKKEVSQMINQAEQTALTQNSKLSTNSQNKLFIRKPVTKRQCFGSPDFSKRIGIQNQQAKSPYIQQTPSKFPSQECLSDRIFYEQKEKFSKLSNKISLKKNASNNQKNNTQTLNIHKSNAIQEAYFGENETHALTQIGETYRNDANEEDNRSENDLMFGEGKQKITKQNMVVNSLTLTNPKICNTFTNSHKISNNTSSKVLINAKKTTRTQYFQSPQQNQQIRSTTSRSRSQRQKQTNFNQLRKSLSTPQAYISSLQQKIRLLEKQTYTLTKKCKWMHQEVEMHLEKEHLLTAEIKGYENQLKGREKIISDLNGKQIQLSASIEEMKSEIQKFKQNDKSKQAHLDKVKMPISNSKRKSLKDGAETISSLKQFCSRVQQKSVLRQSKIQQAFNGYYNNQPCSIQRIKKPSFKTYPGVCSPKKRTSQTNSKSSSIYEVNPSELSFQDLGESSILTTNEKSLHQSNKDDHLLLIQKVQAQNDQILKERDILKQKIDEMKIEMQSMIDEYDETTIANNQILEIKLKQKDELIYKLKEEALRMCNEREQRDKKQNEQRNQEIKLLKVQFQNQLYTLSTRIQQLQSIQSQPQPGLYILQQSLHQTIPQPRDFQTENPLQYFLQQSQISCQPSSSLSHLQQQNKSLRLYIEHLLSHYKYVKIENRMLLKVKEDLQKMEKEKKQIKDERDLFKKKLLDFVKKNNIQAKSNTKNNKRKNMDFCDSSSSQDDQSTVFQLSQSEILHNDSDIKYKQDQIRPNQLNQQYIQHDQKKDHQKYNDFKQN